MGAVACWIALNNVPNLGPRRIALVYRMAGIEVFFQHKVQDISEILGLKNELVRNMLKHLDIQQAKRVEQQCRQKGIDIITLASCNYPRQLAEIYDPPPVLYYKGDFPGKQRLLAVVGSRKATPYGGRAVAQLVPGLTRAGLGIVSGLARGIDAGAHSNCLEAEGYTVAVLGNGVDICYPASNRQLQQAVACHGCLISEFMPGTRPKAAHFPRRNRIISGLCQGLLVVEAGLKSGAMITVGFALEQGRDVFAVPGNIDSAQSAGTNHLIRMGAKPALGLRDVLEEYGLDLPLAQTQVTSPQLDEGEKEILALVQGQGISVDELCSVLQIPSQVVLARLVALEIKGLIDRLPGQKYVRSSRMEV